MTTLHDFLKENTTEIGAFTPSPLYTPEGDSLTFYMKDEESYGERIDDLLTVYRSMETHAIIGCQIKGVRHKLDELRKYSVAVTSNEFELGLLFLAYMANSTDKTVQHNYEFLGKEATKLGARFRPEEILQSNTRCTNRTTDKAALVGK